MNREDCINFEDCKTHSEEKDLNCQDCDHYVPDSCWEDYEGKKPFWALVRDDD